MKYTLKYILPLFTLTFSLTAIPDQYMPYVDPFVYTLQHADMYPAAAADISLTTTPETPAFTNSSPGSGTDTPLPTTSPTFAIAQVNDYVNVRSAPSTESEIVGKLYNGAVAEIQATAGTDNDWFQIVSGSVTGYIKSEYFLSGEEATAVMDTYVRTYATILADRLNVRKEASTDAKRMGYLEEAEQVLVLEDLGDWLHIQYTNTTDGYISKEYARLSESYIYALSPEEEAAQRSTYQTRASRIQTTETIKPENTKIEFPATTYTSNEELRKAIVENAMQYVGDKYVHGGNSLETGTDCSGFTMLIMAQYGYSISRTPSGQYSSAGRSIDYSEIQPGDIICYTSNGSSCTHVAFYIGDGQIVHAANSRKGVIVGKADYSTILGIKNVID